MVPFVLTMLVATAAIDDARAPVFAPASPRSWFMTPGENVTLRLRLASGTAADRVPYRVVDYSGKLTAQGELRRTAAGNWEIALRPEPGFFEVELPGTSQRFGVVSLPESKDKPDPFFAIDGGLSWLEHDAARREDLILIARRSGISMVRERLSWASINPGQKQWNWEGGAGYETIRQFYRNSGVSILELAHDSPEWLGRVGKYPRDLVSTGASWAEIGRRWHSAWGGLEIWNEPDIEFGGNLPADQYVALAKTLSYSLSQAGLKSTLVGGVMAVPNRDFRETCGRSGLLDRVDAFSFHNYDKANALEVIVMGYREWLRKYGHGAMPLWLTECGRPWKRGPDRPPIDQDQISALDITMKGVEALACGIARYFPFVYPYYEENTNNFGMMDRRLTPLRSFAAYAQMIRVLATHQYMGDLRHSVPTLQRARLFGNDGEVIAVLYTGEPNAVAAVTLDLPVERIEGIDGRRLLPKSDGSIPIPDGLAYVWINRAGASSRLIADTAASRMRPERGSGKARTAPSPIVLRFQLDDAHFQPSSHGYRVKEVPVGKVRLGFEIWNLADHDAALELGLRLDVPGISMSEPIHTLHVGPRSSQSVEWRADLDELIGRASQVNAQVVARDTSGLRDELNIMLSGEADLARTLAGARSSVPLPIGDRSRWTANISPHGAIDIDSTSESAWRLRVKHEGGRDRWVYPFFRLPPEVHLDRADSLIVRARCARRASVRIFLWEGDKDIGYITPDPIIPADGKWHVGRVQFRDLTSSTANTPDPNGRLDLDLVRRISLGMNSAVDENTLEVSDFYVVAGENFPTKPQ